MSKITQNQEGEPQTFVSPILVFLFGTPLAALNWWRMKNRKKAIIFLFLLVLLSFIISWFEPKMHIRVSDVYLGLIRYQDTLIIAIYNLIIATINSNDIKKFNEKAGKTARVHWAIIIPFILFTFITIVGIQLGFDYLAQNTKYCHFPKYQDILYDNMLDERKKLRSILLTHYDTDCQVNWSIEDEFPLKISDESPQPNSIFLVNLIGHQKNTPESFITMKQVAIQYEVSVTQNMINSVEDGRLSGASNYEIQLGVPHAKTINYLCTQEKYKECFIILGYKNIIIWFQISATNITNTDFHNLVNQTIRKVDSRVNQYEHEK